MATKTDRPTAKTEPPKGKAKPTLNGVDSLLLKQARKSISRTLHRLDELKTEVAILDDPEKRQAHKDRIEAEIADLKRVLSFHMDTAKGLETGSNPDAPQTPAHWQVKQITRLDNKEQ